VSVVWRQFSYLSAISWWEWGNLQWDDDEVRFVLDQQAEFDFHRAISLRRNYVTSCFNKNINTTNYVSPILSDYAVMKTIMYIEK